MVVSVWASFMASWLTPTSLFLLLNLTIGTIFLMTRFGTPNNPQLGPPHDSPRPARSSSLLDRVRSVNFSLYKFEHPSSQPELHHLPDADHVAEYSNHQPRIERTPSLLERLKSINLSAIYNRSDQPEAEVDRGEPIPEVHDQGVKRSKSEASVARSPPAEKITKSASEKLGQGGGGDDEEEEEEIAVVERRRPATAKVEKSVKESQTASFGEDDGVDAKADDFINRFKQQLKLQRLESLKRFSEMWKGK